MKGKDGATAWRRPNYATIDRMIENPVYGGAYAYGTTAVAAGYDAAGVSVKICPQGAQRLAGADAERPRRLCQLGEG